MYKHDKAKKFSSQYKGPYKIDMKVSALIYKVRLLDGNFAIVHVNRLKKAYDRKLEVDRTLLRRKQGKLLGKLKETRDTSRRETFEDKFEQMEDFLLMYN